MFGKINFFKTDCFIVKKVKKNIIFVQDPASLVDISSSWAGGRKLPGRSPFYIYSFFRFRNFFSDVENNLLSRLFHLQIRRFRKCWVGFFI